MILTVCLLTYNAGRKLDDALGSVADPQGNYIEDTNGNAVAVASITDVTGGNPHNINDILFTNP
jgi:hypothetical protein